MKFTKMLGAGKDFVFVDCFTERMPRNPHGLAVEVADRQRGIGAEALILIEPSSVADVRIRSYGASGEEAVACSSGIRCVAKYLFDHKLCEKTRIQIEAESNIMDVDVFPHQDVADLMRVDMGPPQFALDREIDSPLDIQGYQLPVSLLKMGDPVLAELRSHCVVFVEQLTDRLVEQLGALLEMSGQIPTDSDIEFAASQDSETVVQRTWRCGIGEVASSGTSAGAVCAVGAVSGRIGRNTTHLLQSSQLAVNWDEQNDHVYVTGSAVEVFSGRWNGLS